MDQKNWPLMVKVVAGALVAVALGSGGVVIFGTSTRDDHSVKNSNNVLTQIFNTITGRSADSAGQLNTAHVKISSGLEARVNSVGRSKDHAHVTVSVTLSNTGKDAIFLKLASPRVASDNNGGHYVGETASGMSSCPAGWEATGCIVSVSDVLIGMTQLDPGSQINLDFSLTGTPSNGPLISFSTSMIGRTVADTSKDLSATDEDKKKQLRAFNLSTPQIRVTDAQ